MVDIKGMFDENEYDKFTLNCINAFLNEFLEVFGEKYLTKEELVERIKNNLLMVKIVDESKVVNGNKVIGEYKEDEKKITLKKGLKNEYFKQTLFHEFMHAIMENDMYCPGIEEGFVQFMTKERTKFYSEKENKSYPLLTKQIENLANLIGKDELINSMLEDFIYGLEESLQKNEINSNDLVVNLDTIWRYEKELIHKQEETPISQLLDAIFGNKTAIPEEVKLAQIDLCRMYIKKPTNTIDEFKDRLNIINDHIKDIKADHDVYYDIALELFDEYENHPEYHGKLPEDIEEIFANQKIINEFCELSFDEKIKALSTNNELMHMIENSSARRSFVNEIIESMKELSYLGGEEIYYILTSGGLAQKILDGEIKPEEINIEWINEKKFIYNLYRSNGKEFKYIETAQISDLGRGYKDEYRIIKDLDNEKSLSSILDKIKPGTVVLKPIEGSEFFDDYILAFPNGSWHMLSFEKDTQECIESCKLCDETLHKISNIEMLLKRYSESEKRYEKIKEIHGVEFMFKKEKEFQERIIDRLKSYDVIENEEEITPEDIEEAAHEKKVSEKDMKKLLDWIQSIDERRMKKNIFIDTVGGDKGGR